MHLLKQKFSTLFMLLTNTKSPINFNNLKLKKCQ